MSVVIKVKSIDGEEMKNLSFGDKTCKFCMNHPMVLLWCFIIIILAISIGIGEYAK
jgi:hypothetical protein